MWSKINLSTYSTEGEKRNKQGKVTFYKGVDEYGVRHPVLVLLN